MTENLKGAMEYYAKLYANKSNYTKTGVEILDEKRSLPRDCHNAGAWFGFVAGFKMCYHLMIKLYGPNTDTKELSELHEDTQMP